MKQMISLLILLFVFAKYGEPRIKFMSIHGDINMAMFETAPVLGQIGFIYDDRFGGFALNEDYCSLPNNPLVKLIVERTCAVYENHGFSETPSNEHYFVKHYRDFPEENTGTNFIIGYRGSSGFSTKRVRRNDEAFEFTDITRRFSRRNSEVYCNDRNHRHYRNLLKPTYTDHAAIVFGKSNKNRYEQTMKCIAILKASSDNLVAARLFTVAISDLVPELFTFQAERLNSAGGAQYVPSSEPFVSAIAYADKSVVETNFVFRTDDSVACQPTITMEPTEESKSSIYFYYNDQIRKMPPIEVTNNWLNCGVAVVRSATGGEPSFQYMCECMR